MNGGFISNDSDSAIRGSRPRGAVLEKHVCNFSSNENQVNKHNEFKGTSSWGQLSCRKLIEPSAPECRVPAYVAKSTGRERREMIFCYLVVLNTLRRYLNFYAGIVLGVHSATSCGDGNREACSSLERGTPKSKSIFRTYPQDITSRRGNCPGVANHVNGGS